MMEENEVTAGGGNLHQESANMLLDFVRVNERTQNDIFGSSHLGIIEECEKDKNGKYTGKATVRFVTTPGVRTKCLLPVPSGQAYWLGGLPPAGTLCQLTWLPLGVAVVTAIYPLNFRVLVDQKRVIDIIPGELLMQASSGVLKEGQAPAGRGLFDRHGRIQFETVNGAARIVLGDPGLANGLTTLTSNDADAGEKTLIRIQAGDAIVNITDQESIVIKNASAKVMLKDGTITVSSDTLKIEATNIEIVADVRMQVDVTGGKRLATEDFVLNTFNSHMHISGGLATSTVPPIPVVGVSGPPTTPAGGFGDLTEDLKGK